MSKKNASIDNKKTQTHIIKQLESHVHNFEWHLQFLNFERDYTVDDMQTLSPIICKSLDPLFYCTIPTKWDKRGKIAYSK